MRIKPPRLREGDEIGIIAPAGPVTESELEKGLEILESFGYRVSLSPHLYQRKDYLAGDDDARLEDLHTMFLNGRIRAVFCARGGYGTLRLLDKIDFDVIRMNPKIVVGYSDITSLLLAAYKKAGLVTFHGPVVREFSRNKNKNLEAVLGMVSSVDSSGVSLTGGRVLVPGKARGTLLGGNLSLICHLMGTRFMPSLRGSILFIEEKGEPAYRIDRMLTHLKLSGQLEGLKGLMAGGFEGCGDLSSIDRLLLDIISDLHVPMISNLPLGHGLTNTPLPVGVRAEFDTGQMRLSFTEPCVKP